MEKQFGLDYNDAHEETDIDSDIGFQAADRSRIPLCRQDKVRPSDGEGEPPELLLHLPSEALRQESLLLDDSFEKYPVLHFNFSLLDTTTYENFLLGFKNMIRGLAHENGVDVKDSTPTYMLQEFLDKSEKQSVIIIDEFDSPIIDSLDDREKLERIRKAFSNFYNTIKNKSSKIRFLFIAGVTKLSNMSIFSKMNNLTDVSMRAEYASAFGYTDEELEGSFKEYIDDYLSSGGCPYEERNELLSDIREYYDGYRFSVDTDIKVYNPVSVGMFFQNGCRFNNYWEMTGVSTLAHILLHIVRYSRHC